MEITEHTFLPRDPRVSYFRPNIDRMAGYVPGEQPQGGKFIKLNTNENPYPCSSAVNRAVQAVLERGLSKYPDATAAPFRQRAAEVLGVEPDWIIAGNGSDEILTILTRAFVGEGQRLRLPYPSYILYRTLAEIQGAASEEVDFAPDWTLSDRFSDPADELRLVMLPNPNSPSGTVLPPARVTATQPTSSRPIPASARAWSTTAFTVPRWWRAATSGSTPP